MAPTKAFLITTCDRNSEYGVDRSCRENDPLNFARYSRAREFLAEGSRLFFSQRSEKARAVHCADAALRWSTEVVEFLHEHNASLDCLDDHGRPPLVICLMHKISVLHIPFLYSFRVVLLLPNTTSRACLYFENKNLGIIRLLGPRRADRQAFHGRVPRHGHARGP